MEDNKQVRPPNIDNLEMHMPEDAPAPADDTPTERIANAPILILLTMLLLLVLGGLYYWYTLLTAGVNMEENTLEESVVEEPETTSSNSMDITETTGQSDEVGDIEADLNTTSLDEIDAELGDIEAELDASL